MKKVLFDKIDTTYSIFGIASYLKDNQINVDQIIGLTRGGLVPATMLSHYIDKPMIALNKDFSSDEIIREGTILVVDEINDTGKTLSELESYFKTFYPHENLIIKYVSLIENEVSKFKVDYAYRKINKSEDPSWIIFWWEEWWKVYF